MSDCEAVWRLRPVQPDDQAFLFQVYAATRQEELALVPWAEAQKEAFLRMQFDAQQRSYRLQFPSADYRIIIDGDQEVGRLIVERPDAELLLVDIALLPEHRSRGIGTGVIRALQAEAASAGKPLRLHVAAGNRALGLYERLGFWTVTRGDIYLEMEWHP